MTTDTANATNTVARQAKLKRYADACGVLKILQTRQANGILQNKNLIVLAHNAVQEASQALRMVATDGVENVDFEAELDD